MPIVKDNTMITDDESCDHPNRREQLPRTATGNSWQLETVGKQAMGVCLIAAPTSPIDNNARLPADYFNWCKDPRHTNLGAVKQLRNEADKQTGV